MVLSILFQLNIKKSKRFNPKKATFTDNDTGEDDPIQSDKSSKYLFNNEDAIVVNFKKDNDEN